MTRSISEQKCYFTKQIGNYSNVQNTTGVYWLESGELGDYLITQGAVDYLNRENVNPNLYINCAYENIKAFRNGYSILWKLKKEDYRLNQHLGKELLDKHVEDFSSISIDHAQKINNILTVVESKLSNKMPFEDFRFDIVDLFSLKCHSYSELYEWLMVLCKNEILASAAAESFRNRIGYEVDDQLSKVDFTLTPKGWFEVNKNRNDASNLKDVFIAMDFKSTDRMSIQESIENACEKCGFKGFTVDKKEFLGKITDEIIASIKKSKFIIAEFSYNNAGVYFEAGFAEGHNIPVIYVIKESNLDHIHFDTKQINHIVWKDFPDLEVKLVNRIKKIF